MTEEIKEIDINEEILKGMQMLHERLLRVETWMLNQEAKQNEEKSGEDASQRKR